jgi:hypothetical protein
MGPGLRRDDHLEEKIMDEPLKLEIFTDYV